MASFLEKIKVRTAESRNNKFDLSCQHITTQDFFSLRPVYCRELQPKSSISIDQSSFTRLAPLFKPMFGHVRMVNRAFFVPFRVVWSAFNDFVEDGVGYHDGEIFRPTAVPYANTASLLHVIASDALFCVAGTGSRYDFVYHSPGSSSDEFKLLTARGRQLFTILQSLGYNFSTIEDAKYHMNVSLLPLLSFCKIIADWYVNPQYSARRDGILAFISSCWRGGLVDERALLDTLTEVVYSLYDQDYFTSAFDNPLVPNDGTTSSVQFPDFPLTKQTSNLTTSGSISNFNLAGDSRVNYDVDAQERPSPYIESKVALKEGETNLPRNYIYRGIVANLNQYMLDSLKALTTLVKRYQLVGSNTLDRMMSEYGVELPAEKLQRCVYLGKNESSIEVSDVMSTADTESSQSSDSLGVVGDYAGKGIGATTGQAFTYSTDEFGMIIVLSTILPRASYSQGIQRQNLHIDRFDFFHGDFDALGTQAIAAGELFNDMHTVQQYSSVTDWEPNKIFGFTPRYSEYAIAHDFLSGDFRVRSLGAEGDLRAWHMFRMFNPTDEDQWNELLKHSEDFSVGDAQDYDYIFNYSPDDQNQSCDHFFVSHVFRITLRAPKKPLYDQFDFDNEGVDKILHLGGTNLN